MRVALRSFAFAAALGCGLAAACAPRASAAAARLPYRVVTSAYFVKNTVTVDDRAFFIVRNAKAFDARFGFGAVMGPPQPTVDGAVYAKGTILAIAVDGLCTLTPTSVTGSAQAVTVAYTKTCAPPSSARYVTPLLIELPSTLVRRATFVENGRAPITIAKPAA